MNTKKQTQINEEFVESARANDVHRTVGLLAQGADLEAKDNDGRTALMHACKRGEYGIALALLEKGADLEAKDNDGYTALMYACALRDCGIASALLEEGANLEAKDNYGRTALMVAARNGRTGLTIQLLEKGADMEATEKDGQTALILASRYGCDDVALALITHGADSMKLPPEEDFHGFTPLQACAAGGLLPRLQELLENLAPRNLASEQPQALIELALKYNQSDAAGVIQAHLAKNAVEQTLSQRAKKPSSA